MSSQPNDIAVLSPAIAAYLGHVRSSLQSRHDTAQAMRTKPGAESPVPAALRDWAREFEQHATWTGLVKTCVRIFSTKGHDLTDFFWSSALGDWFRNRGVYLACLQRSEPSPEDLSQHLVHGLETESDRITFLAPLNGVDLANDEMDFGHFQIIRPTRMELETLLRIPTNKIFYPYATTSTYRLANHWYVRAQLQQQRHKIGYFSLPEELFSGTVRPRYSRLPPAIENPLKRIVLWDWHPVFSDASRDDFVSDDRWEGFDIPFIISISDDPFEAPQGAPPVERLSYEPDVDESGQQVGEVPSLYFSFDKENTSAFATFVRSLNTQLDNVLSTGEPWYFVDHALNYLVKGFFSEGIEQMLWHIISLEALFGEKGLGGTDRLSKRLAGIYSDDKTKNDAARQAFVDLYNLRSDLVHGRPFRAPAHQRHLRVARTLARTAAWRMLQILDHLAGALKAGKLRVTPTREEILQVIDLDPDSRKRFAHLIAQFP